MIGTLRHTFAPDSPTCAGKGDYSGRDLKLCGGRQKDTESRAVSVVCAFWHHARGLLRPSVARLLALLAHRCLFVRKQSEPTPIP